MAASVTKSPSRNPNSRSSEINNPMRRSFSGNPFGKPSIVTKPKGFNSATPANSPSDFPRRNSISRENLLSLRDYEDKENGKEQELKTARGRSPSVLKGTKNFMSPTISAASKITSSPKKKILAEKNESVRASFSISSSDGKRSGSVSFSDVLEFIDVKPEIDSDQKNVEVSDDSTVAESEHKVADLRAPLLPKALGSDPKAQSTPKNGSRSNPAAHFVEADCVNLDFSSIASSPCPSRAILAPLDADPLMRPYDPETNYTSPRPQFLHYRPNPRIGVYLNRGKELEETFISESSSDAEVTEETQSEDSQKDSEDASSCEMVKEELSGEEVKEEEISCEVMKEEQVSGEMVKEVSGETVKEEEEEEVVVHESEPNLISSTDVCKETVEAKRVSKLHFFRRPKTVAFLLTLLVACLSVSVTDSPVVGLVLKDRSYSTFYVPAEFTEYAKAHLDGLAQNFGLWYAKSISYLSELVSNLGVRKLGTLKYSNLSGLYDEHLIEGYPFFSQLGSETKDKFQENVMEPEPVMGRERVLDTESLVEKVYPEIEVDENDGDASEGHDDPESEEQEHEKVEVEVHDSSEVVQEEHDITASEVHGDLVAGHEYPESEVFDYSEKVVEEHSTPEAEVHFTPEAEASETNNLEAEHTQENGEFAPHMDINNSESSMDFKELSESPDIEAELSKAEDLLGENDMHPSSETESSKAEESPESSELDASTEGTEISKTVDLDELSQLNVLVALLLLTLLAAIAFFAYEGKEDTRVPLTNTSALNTMVSADQHMLTKKFDISPKSARASVEYSFQERLSSRNWPTEVDLVGESCPTEMSSLQKSPSYSNNGMSDASEAQSQERKPRKNYKRESLASSDYSVGSLSYGSFTTYEKISSKYAKREEETITPVRRSSRIIRKQVTSP